MCRHVALTCYDCNQPQWSRSLKEQKTEQLYLNHITYVSLQCEIYRKVNFLYEFKILRLFYGRKKNNRHVKKRAERKFKSFVAPVVVTGNICKKLNQLRLISGHAHFRTSPMANGFSVTVR